MNAAVIGASDNPDKYSYQAVILLKEKGHTVFPVHNKIKEIEGVKVYTSIKAIPSPIDTASIYVSEMISNKIGDDIIEKKPRRIIFNPGAENSMLQMRAKSKGIEALNACTLTMLRTGQF